jgi:hypothetical protein
MEETSGGLWKALLDGLPPDERKLLTEVVERELREQRIERLRATEQGPSAEASRRRPGRPRKLRRT